MKIKRIKLCNFSSYTGECEINLDTDPGKNVILIGGNNGAGKTSLFTAIKLALYGPQCFRFQDKNNQYTARLRSLINHDAFLAASMKSYVELEIELPIDQQIKNYAIRREWFLQEKSIEERFSVIADEVELNEKDMDFFQNYLFSVIPPNIFDLFFFDGEEVGKTLSSGKHKQFLRDAVLTLSGFDTFSIIQKFCRTFVQSEEEEEAFTDTVFQLERTNRRISELEQLIDQEATHLKELQTQQIHSEEELFDIKAKFSRSGGLNDSEREEIEAELVQLDHIKTESSRKIRGFVESLMPIFITKDLAEQARTQLDHEKVVRQYEEVQSALSFDVIHQIIQDIPNFRPTQPERLAQALASGIASHLKPNVDLADFANIHDLSKEQEQQVSAIITNLHNFSVDDMIELCKERTKASEQYDSLMKKLRSSMPQIDVEEYDHKVSVLSTLIQYLTDMINKTEKNVEQAKLELKEQTALQERLNKTLQQQSRYQTAYMYTDRIRHIMECLLSSTANKKRYQIAELALEVFSRIIRKENYIQLIELDNDFSVSIYKKQEYTLDELSALLRNTGPESFERRLGTSGIDKAAKLLGISSKQELYAFLTRRRGEGQLSLLEKQTLELYNRVDLEQFSKGEKQVFIFSLYWAIIKTAHRQIPFMIDTPFARIDTEHRAQISRVFFPEISDQVIVFSTDEEVVGVYYEALSPFIAREYFLEYDIQNSRTIVHNGYFNEVHI